MMEQWAAGKLSKKRGLVDPLLVLSRCKFPTNRIVHCDHHTSHAASAFFPSPFDGALILTIDGVGEWATTRVSVGNGGALDILDEIRFPHSLGLFYAAGTAHLGFKINSGEYKVMGLAPYGSPTYAKKLVEEVIDMKPDGSFRLNMEYFDYCVGMRMTNEKFAELVGFPPRNPEDPLTQNHMDLAASLQRVTEEVLLNLVTAVHNRFGGENLCLAGGVALNCVANGRILREGRFERVWIQPASGDAGNALGAALWAYHCHLGASRTVSPNGDSMKGAFLGSCYTDEEIEAALRDAGVIYQRLSKDDLIERVADDLTDGMAVGWFQGRMEFGPRALGARSILADPRCPKMQKNLNLKIKYRESFRPFAPAVLAEKAADWFDLDTESPYMLLVAQVKADHIIPTTADQERLFGLERLNIQRSSIPAVTHVDYSARVQTVHRRTNPRFFELIARFSQKSGCDVLLNTSFNVRGEPIVESPLDAVGCFMGTELDALAIGSFYLLRTWQPESLRLDYRNRFEPD
jgi:carbamoyltransferase